MCSIRVKRIHTEKIKTSKCPVINKNTKNDLRETVFISDWFSLSYIKLRTNMTVLNSINNTPEVKLNRVLKYVTFFKVFYILLKLIINVSILLNFQQFFLSQLVFQIFNGQFVSLSFTFFFSLALVLVSICQSVSL